MLSGAVIARTTDISQLTRDTFVEREKKTDIPFIESGSESRLTTRVVNFLCQCTTAKSTMVSTRYC